jgi:hypothetical protein
MAITSVAKPVEITVAWFGGHYTDLLPLENIGSVAPSLDSLMSKNLPLCTT